MKKLIMLLPIAILLSLCSYSQPTGTYPWKENNRYLAERAECVQLLNVQYELVDKKDSVIRELYTVISDKDKQISTVKENEDIAETKEKAAFAKLSTCNKEKQDEKDRADKQERGKKFWRGVAVVTTVIAAATIYIATNTN